MHNNPCSWFESLTTLQWLVEYDTETPENSFLKKAGYKYLLESLCNSFTNGHTSIFLPVRFDRIVLDIQDQYGLQNVHMTTYIPT